MKAAGVLLVCGGCLWWSIRACQRQRLMLCVLEDMTGAVEYLERELELGQRPVPELLEQLTNRGCQPVRAAFDRCRRALEGGVGLPDSWQAALAHTGLDRQECRALEPLGWLLGRYDAQGQGASLVRLHRHLEQMVEQRRRRTAQQVRVIGALGVTAGGFLSLTLI